MIPFLKRILTNPMVLAAALAIPFSFFTIPLPVMTLKVLEPLSKAALPLALIGIGGSLDFKENLTYFRESFLASLLKVAVYPLLVLVIARFLKVSPESYGILFLFGACPPAISAFTLTRAMGGNQAIASGYMVLSLVLSLLVSVSGVMVFYHMGLV